MKKLLAVLLFLAFAVSPVLALPVSFGLKAGVAFSNFNGTDAEALAQGMSEQTTAALKSKMFIAGGGFLSISAGGMWGIQPEVLYVRKGTTIKAGSVEGDVNLDYLTIPVLLKLNLLPAKSPASPFIFAGPSISINMSANTKGPDGSSVDIKEMVNSADFGLVFGGGLDIKKFSLDARYELGLGNPIKAEGGYTPKIHNGTLYVMAGYKLF
jgi:hypothetical protein